MNETDSKLIQCYECFSNTLTNWRSSRRTYPRHRFGDQLKIITQNVSTTSIWWLVESTSTLCEFPSIVDRPAYCRVWVRNTLGGLLLRPWCWNRASRCKNLDSYEFTSTSTPTTNYTLIEIKLLRLMRHCRLVETKLMAKKITHHKYQQLESNWSL